MCTGLKESSVREDSGDNLSESCTRRPFRPFIPWQGPRITSDKRRKVLRREQMLEQGVNSQKKGSASKNNRIKTSVELGPEDCVFDRKDVNRSPSPSAHREWQNGPMDSHRVDCRGNDPREDNWRSE